MRDEGFGGIKAGTISKAHAFFTVGTGNGMEMERMRDG